MKLLTTTVDYSVNIALAKSLPPATSEDYVKPCIFHSYWNGDLNKKHLYSIKSCYYWNIFNQSTKKRTEKQHKIVLWLENNCPNDYNLEIAKYAEIRSFSLRAEQQDTLLQDYQLKYTDVTFYADFVRCLLLYKYGGCWFDLDCFFLRSFDPLFKIYGNEICVYTWERQNYPNNAIFFSLEVRSERLKRNIEFIRDRNRGWGFQLAWLTFDLDLDMLVLPCAWFDPDWIDNPHQLGHDRFFKKVSTTGKKYCFDNFFEGAFCYHWHNKWNNFIEEDSPIEQLNALLNEKLGITTPEGPRNKKIISYCLWGDVVCYTFGMIINAIDAMIYYPGWIVRVYHAQSVPKDILDALSTFKHVELISMPGPGDNTSMFWRFSAICEADVEVMISRDSDSRLSYREAVAVSEWLETDKGFHTMRDNTAHNINILGGMWGARRGAIPNMRQLLDEFSKEDTKGNDQSFLHHKIWPIVRDNWVEHDPYYAKKPFTIPRTGDEFIGQPVYKDYYRVPILFPNLQHYLNVKAHE